jgi:hypothetical protein
LKRKSNISKKNQKKNLKSKEWWSNLKLRENKRKKKISIKDEIKNKFKIYKIN